MSAQDRMNEAAAEAQRWSEENQLVGGVCDFCCHLLPASGTIATWTVGGALVTEMIEIADGDVGRLTIVDSPDWAACEACDAVIATGDPRALALRAWEQRDKVRVGVGEERRDYHLARLESLYRRFFAGNPVRTEETR